MTSFKGKWILCQELNVFIDSEKEKLADTLKLAKNQELKPELYSAT